MKRCNGCSDGQNVQDAPPWTDAGPVTSDLECSALLSSLSVNRSGSVSSGLWLLSVITELSAFMWSDQRKTAP